MAKEETKKAPKPEKEKGEKVEGAKRKYAENHKITIKNKENPHREGSGRAKAFDDLLKCKTMGDYYNSGHKLKYIDAWVESEHIAV
jgi:hypothetical protein